MICVFIRVRMIEVLVVGNGIDQFLYIELKSQCPFALFECKCILCRKLPTCSWKREILRALSRLKDKVKPFHVLNTLKQIVLFYSLYCRLYYGSNFLAFTLIPQILFSVRVVEEIMLDKHIIRHIDGL